MTQKTVDQLLVEAVIAERKIFVDVCTDESALYLAVDYRQGNNCEILKIYICPESETRHLTDLDQGGAVGDTLSVPAVNTWVVVSKKLAKTVP